MGVCGQDQGVRDAGELKKRMKGLGDHGYGIPFLTIEMSRLLQGCSACTTNDMNKMMSEKRTVWIESLSMLLKSPGQVRYLRMDVLRYLNSGRKLDHLDGS